MTSPASHYTIEPYIGDGKPQWAVIRTYTEYRPSLFSDGAHQVESIMCIVDTEDEARALIAHVEQEAK